MSLPTSRPVRPAASAAAAPPDEPPGPRARSQGLLVVPWISLKVSQSESIKGTLVLPKITAPDALSRLTTSESRVAMFSLKAGSPQVVGRPARSKDSLTVIGRPSSGPSTSPRARLASDASAALRAAAISSAMIALIAGLKDSTRDQ